MKCVRFLSLLLPFTVFIGCGDSDSRPDPTTDAGVTGDSSITDSGPPPGTPDEVPVVRLLSDAATACPGAFASTAPSPGYNSGFTVAGQNRGFQLLLPPATFTGPRPLFLAIHGTESLSGWLGRASLEDYAAKGFVVIAPEGNGNGTVWPIWDDMRQPDNTGPNPDLEFIDTVMACVAAHVELDENRLYVGGHSAGGIFTNAIIQRRSDVFAGAIVGSGILELTAPPTPQPLDKMFVIVTWGGDDDAYSGGVGVTVPEINFVEQASLATKYYEMEANVGQMNCSVNPGLEGGHWWLSPLNDYFIERLLEHPKGLPGNVDLTVPPAPFDDVTCTEEVFEYEGGIEVTCPSSETDDCQEYCQFVADCGVSNSTVGPILAPQFGTMGFSGADNVDCGGCVSKCEADVTNDADEDVLECISEAREESMCGPGISGALPVVNAIDNCCMGRRDSPFCVEVCGILLTNSAASTFFPNCAAL